MSSGCSVRGLILVGCMEELVHLTLTLWTEAKANLDACSPFFNHLLGLY